MFCRICGRFLVGRVCSALSWVNFQSAECVPPCPGSISSWQSVFCHVPVQFPVGRVCSAMSWVDFGLAECVPPLPGSIFGRYSMFHHVQGQFEITFVPIHFHLGDNLTIFPKMRDERTDERTNGKKIRLLKYPFAMMIARDLKKHFKKSITSLLTKNDTLICLS